LEQLCPTFAEYRFYEGAFSAGSMVSAADFHGKAPDNPNFSAKINYNQTKHKTAVTG
jgi:hypothetical protein